ncbi:MAG: ferrous iron transport protein B [Candidatus Kapaibacterium sp.]
MTLYDLNKGEKAIITKVRGRGAFRKRILEMGFIAGREIQSLKEAPLKDPVEYKIMDYHVSLRNSEAKLIDIITPEEALQFPTESKNFSLKNGDLLKQRAREKEKVINIALVGNPNSGKTTLFNHASHSRERVGNYGGVTVDSKQATFKMNGYTFNIVDLPGTYSISAYSPEELFVRNYLNENMPDLVVNVVDVTNLERNMYLTTQLIDMDLQMIVALNMYDELTKRGDEFKYEELGKMLGIPMVPTVSSKGKGVKELFARIIQVYEGKDNTVRHIHINYGHRIENSISIIQDKINHQDNIEFTSRYSTRFTAIKLLEKDNEVKKKVSGLKNGNEIIDVAEREIKKIEKDLREDTETLITDAKYGFIQGALQETYEHRPEEKLTRSEVIDKIVTHKLWGIPTFLFFMWLTFYATFTLGELPMQLIEAGVGAAAGFFGSILNDGLFKDLLIDGIIGGVGGVLIFLPNIILLYMFISLMEDTGYMARAVFIMDKAMHKIGLHGKSFIPLLMGFGCNVPAIMSARIIESKRDRLLTILINPFMSCSARLPVYVLFISAFFVDYRGTILFSIYLTGVLLAIITAVIFNKTLFKTQDIPFVMELPPYRFPTARAILRHMWFRASMYIKKIGGVILAASIVIWALGYFPRHPEITEKYDRKIEQVKSEYSAMIKQAPPVKAEELAAEKELKINDLKLESESERQSQSYIGHLGRAVQPLMAPLGFDWKMTISLIAGVSAKEVVVSTLGVLYQATDEPMGEEQSLVKKIQEQEYLHGGRKGEKVFTPLVAMSFMIFILVYFPCIGVVAAIKREAGGWRWSLFSMAYTTILAWLLSFMVFQIGSIIF